MARGGPVKAITLTQPWASLVALGHKRVETRSWSTTYRGPLAIHAAKGFPRWAKAFASEEWALGRLRDPRIPRAAVVAICRLADVRRTEDVSPELSGLERHLGDYTPGRFAWFLEDIEPLAEPVPARGAQGLWEWPEVARG